LKYTPKLHRYRLGLMLNRADACTCCPILKGFVTAERPLTIIRCCDNSPSSDISENDNCCRICLDFIQFPHVLGLRAPRCPCRQLGTEEAIARTGWYIDLWDRGEHPLQNANQRGDIRDE